MSKLASVDNAASLLKVVFVRTVDRRLASTELALVAYEEHGIVLAVLGVG